MNLIKSRLGFTRACSALGVAKSSLHRYLSGERRMPGHVVGKALEYIDRSEFESIVSDLDRLRALSVTGLMAP